MSDITAQEFREEAAYFAHLAAGERRMKDDLGKRAAADLQRHADLMLIAAEQCELVAAVEKLKNDALAQYDGALAGIEGMPDVSMGNYDEQQWHFGFRRGFKHRSELCDTISTLEQQIAVLRAERDAALDKLRAHSVE